MTERTIGTGGDYATIQAALTAIHNGGVGAADDWTLTVISNITETGNINSVNCNGYTILITVADGAWHEGRTTRGYQVSVGANVSPRACIGNSGVMIVERLRFVKTAANTGGSATYLLNASGVTGGACRFYLRDLMFDGANLAGTQVNDGLQVGISNTDYFRVSNCKIWDCTRRGMQVDRTTAIAGDYRGRKYLENITVRHCVTGFYVESNDTTDKFDVYCRNCVAVDCTTIDWSMPDAGSGSGTINVLTSCGDSDDSIDAISGGTKTGTVANLVSADEFASVTDTSVDFLRLPYGALAASATTSALTGRAPHDVTFRGSASYGFSGRLYNAGVVPLYVVNDISALQYATYEDSYPIGCHNCRVTP